MFRIFTKELEDLSMSFSSNLLFLRVDVLRTLP